MPVLTQAALLRKASGTIVPGDFEANIGTLSPEQSSAFLDRIYVSTPMTQLQRNERRRSMTGTIAKMGISGRNLRKKNPGVDDSFETKPNFDSVAYAIQRYRMDSSIEEEVFEEGIEQDGFEDHWLNTVAGQVGRDLEDLHFNGDESSSDLFLNLNRGWLRQIALSATAHRVNGGTINGGNISKDDFFAAYQALPDAYKAQSDQMRWFMSPTNKSRWLEYLTNRATPAGDAAIFGQGGALAPHGIQILEIPSMPNDRILLSAVRNFIVVYVRDLRFRKTTEGREAIREDKRFYAWFISDDPIIEEDAGIADIYGLTA
jgi:hypothetical protein